MKKFYITAFLALSLSHFAAAKEDVFRSLEKEMDPTTYGKSGLATLTSEQRAVIDNFVRNYVEGKQKAAADVAATQAVDRAVKERKVRPPDVIESNMVGSYNGYGPRTFFHLANGQTWRPTNDEVVRLPAIDSPKVLIYRDFLGFQMFIEGASPVHVKRVQ